MKTELEIANERILELEEQVKKLTSNTLLADSFPLSEERTEELSLILANHDFDSNIGKVIMPLKVCRQIVRMITENFR